LKLVMTLAGEVRDMDVALHFVAAAGVRPLEARLHARRKQMVKTLVAVLKHWSARKSFSKWRNALESELPTPEFRRVKAEAFAHREMPRLAARFFREGARAASAGASVAERHRFRLAAKKFRYTLELFAGFYGPAALSWIAQVKELQSLLGAITDCRTVRALVDSLGGDPKLDASLKKRQRRKSLEFQRLWETRFGGGDAARQWIQALGHPPRKPVKRSATSHATPNVALQA
jgi:CHAD domain-containing protein